MPKVSVVIPSFNGVKRGFIFEAILSVLGQSVQPDEIIVVDDGSSDGTADQVRKQFDNVKVISKPNGGLSSARNYGIKNAANELVAILDDDDIWLPNKLEAQTKMLEEDPGLDLVCCGLIRFDSAGKILGNASPALNRLSYPEILLGGNPITGPSGVILKRSLWARINGFDESLKAVEDYDFWIRASRVGKLGGTPEPLVKYRVHAGQMSASQVAMGKMVLEVLKKNAAYMGERALKRISFYYAFSALAGSLANKRIEDIQYWTKYSLTTFNFPVALLRVVSICMRFSRKLQASWRHLEVRYIFSGQNI